MVFVMFKLITTEYSYAYKNQDSTVQFLDQNAITDAYVVLFLQLDLPKVKSLYLN
jgi:hypothetical protein